MNAVIRHLTNYQITAGKIGREIDSGGNSHGSTKEAHICGAKSVRTSSHTD